MNASGIKLPGDEMDVNNELLLSYGIDQDTHQQVLDHMFPLDIYEYASRKAYLIERNNPNRDPGYDFRNIESWQRSYNNIRDPSWPDCPSPEDFVKLPFYIQEECRLQHGFSADTWLDPDLPFEKFQSDPTWQLDAFDVVRLKLAVLDNLNAIRHRNVIDFGTHIGLVGTMCLHNDARHVIVTNVKKDCLEIANEMLAMNNPLRHKFMAVLSDINNLDETEELCRDRDTVILAAIMNIVTDHYGIMRAITRHRPLNVIIQNWHPPVIASNPAPLVYWWLEDTTVAWKGYHDTEPVARVGCPNRAWFNTVMQDFGYSLKKDTTTYIASPFAQDTKEKIEFLTLVYELE